MSLKMDWISFCESGEHAVVGGVVVAQRHEDDVLVAGAFNLS